MSTTISNIPLSQESEALLRNMRNILDETEPRSRAARDAVYKDLFPHSQISRPFILPPDLVDISGVPINPEANRTRIYQGILLGRDPVAVKVMRQGKSDEIWQARFLREAELWHEAYTADARSPDGEKRILPFWGLCPARDPNSESAYMISPWMHKGMMHVYAFAQKRSMDYRPTIISIAKGVQLLHNLQDPIVHGDLRPENILVRNDHQIFIGDFGCAQRVSDGPATVSRDALTGSRIHRYCAPEILATPIAPHPSADIYMLAMTIYELITQNVPFPNYRFSGPLIDAILWKKERPARPTSTAAVCDRHLDDGLWTLLNRCWSEDPAQRPDINEVVRELEEWSTRTGYDLDS